ncbi:MAG TPA: hypothetical protein VFK41_05940 [Nocardioidaceae bacterium]|nr:hypothetical protein [Nocardioidaceae bacterium]
MPKVVAALAVAVALGAVAIALLVRPWADSRAGEDATGGSCVSHTDKRPVRAGTPVVGVATVNVERTRRARPIVQDMRRIARTRSVDVVGWQEADVAGFQENYRDLERLGWRTKVFTDGDGALQVPISWRPAVFTLLGTDAVQVTEGAGPDETTHPFRPKWVTSVRLRHLDSGRVLTVMNTHAPNHVETGDDWQDNVNAVYARLHYARLAELMTARPRADVVAMGDLQWDHRDDRDARPDDGITETFEGRVLSSFEDLGLEGLCPTRYSRWIDYILVPTAAVEAGRMEFVTHRTLAGYGSDHRPMVARIALTD